MAGILGRQPDWALLDVVFSRSGGNPFFAEELTAARDATSLPSVLRNVILLRVEQLSPPARRVVAVTAAAGLAIDHGLLAAAAGLDADALTAAISEAVDHHVMTSERTHLRFRHALQREAVYAALVPPERIRLHLDLASCSVPIPVSARAARDTPQSNGPNTGGRRTSDRGASPSIAGGRRNAALLALPEAYAHYERALAACGRIATNRNAAASMKSNCSCGPRTPRISPAPRNDRSSW